MYEHNKQLYHTRKYRYTYLLGNILQMLLYNQECIINKSVSPYPRLTRS